MCVCACTYVCVSLNVIRCNHNPLQLQRVSRKGQTKDEEINYSCSVFVIRTNLPAFLSLRHLVRNAYVRNYSFRLQTALTAAMDRYRYVNQRLKKETALWQMTILIILNGQPLQHLWTFKHTYMSLQAHTQQHFII